MTAQQRLAHVCAPAFAVATLLSSLAFAQTDGTRRQARPLAQSLQGQAKEAYTAAMQLFKQGDFPGAEAQYGQAYDLSKDPRLVFDLAVCEKELHHYARMGALLQRYKDEAGANLSAEDRTTVETALAALPKYIGSVTVRVDTPGAAVFVDGESVGTTPLPGAVPLDPGKHTFSLRKDGYASVERPISVSAGASTTLEIDLLQETNAPTPVTTTESRASPGVPPEQPPGTRWTPLVYGGLGVAAVGVVVGSITGVMALTRLSSVKDRCDGTTCPTSVDGDLQSVRTLGDVSTIAFATAGVGAALGVTAFLWPRRSPTTAAPFHITPWIAAGSAGVAGSF